MKNRETVTGVIVAVGIFIFGLVTTFTPVVQAEQNDQVTQQYLNRLQYALNFILENYVDEIPPEQLYEGAMKGMFDSLDDPYSYYLTASDMADLTDTTTGQFGGVGLYISRPSRSEEESEPANGRDIYIKVVAPIEDTPAYRAGIHAGDYITEVNDTSTADLTVDEVVEILRGEPGTKVTVTILRGKNISFDVDLKRAIIEIPTVKYDMIGRDTAYIRIIQFTPYTDDRVKEAINEFSQKGFEHLIIDVRGNPGGLLDSVTETVDLLQTEGTIVSTRSRVPSENEYFLASPDKVVPDDMPIVVLIDEGSASASEILAGALKDTGRGVLIGETSFGKGSVQKIIPFGQSGFKLTISRYYTPSGVNIDKVGIDPHIEVKDPEFTDEENEALKQILEQRLITRYVDENPEASEREKDAFVDRLQDEYNISLDDEVLRKLIRNEFHRRMDFPPVYDLEYDKALLKAVELLRDGTIAEMIEEARSRTPVFNSGAGGQGHFSIFDVPSVNQPDRIQKAKP